MKTIKWVLLSFSIILVSCEQFKGYEIKGTIQNVEKGLAILEVLEMENKLISDTAKIENGLFNFKGIVDEAVRAKITIHPEGKQDAYFHILIENTKITINGDYNETKEQYGQFYIPDVSIEGGPNIKLEKEYSALYEKVKNQEKYNKYNEAIKKLEKVRELDYQSFITQIDSVNKLYPNVSTEISQEYKEAAISLIKENPDVEYSGFILSMQARDMKLKELDKIFNSLTPKVQNATFSEKIKEEINNLKAMEPGNIAPDFTLQTQNGESFTLSSLRGKYVLVDFWASWCKPCRAAVPELKKLYEDYKDKGFEIVGIANDSRESDWLKAIEEDKTTWIHVIDEFPIKNKPAKTSTLYAIHFLPSYFLIAPDGKIIGKMDKEEVIEKMKELL